MPTKIVPLAPDARPRRGCTKDLGCCQDRAVDQRAAATSWGQSSCTHTDAGPEAVLANGQSHGSAWWQVDLGGVATVDHISVWHRTDCCQDRLMSAQIWVSDTGSTG